MTKYFTLSIMLLLCGFTSQDPETEIEIRNDTVRSSGSIIVYNVAGQVVATASQEFSINSLNAGVYFVATAEGAAKIVK